MASRPPLQRKARLRASACLGAVACLGAAGLPLGCDRAQTGSLDRSSAPSERDASAHTPAPDGDAPSPDATPSDRASGSNDARSPDATASPEACFALDEPSPRDIVLPADCPSDPDFGPDVARTPAASYFAEQAAREISGSSYAPWDLYLRTREEVCRMIEADAELFAFEAPGINKDLRIDFIILAAPTVLGRIRDGVDPKWNCLAPLLGARTENGRFNDEPALHVFLAGNFDSQVVTKKLGEIEGVTGVITPLPFGVGRPSACVFEREGIHHYLLAIPESSPAGEGLVHRWVFEGRHHQVDLVDEWEGPSTEPPPAAFLQPECFELTGF